MKRVAAILLLAIVGTAIGMWAATISIATKASDMFFNGQLDAPRVVLPITRRDLGAIPAHMPLEASFTIHNAGTRRLIVRREDSACCGQTEQESTVIVMPGDSVQLLTAVDQTAPFGRLEKSITYTTNDPDLPRFELKVSATIAKSKL